MLYYDRIDVSEGIDVNKTSASKECDICHYCHKRNIIKHKNLFSYIKMGKKNLTLGNIETKKREI